jgi:EF-P beta-lysylation protein EpmB
MPLIRNISQAPDSSVSVIAPVTDPDNLWKKELANACRSTTELLERLALSDYIELVDTRPDFQCMVTDSYIRKMKTGDINDPLLRQVLPLKQETRPCIQDPGTSDPVGDANAMVSRGLLHKYHGRALLVSTAACAVHCRYCFRRNYPYQQSTYNKKALHSLLQYLDEHPEIEEIILSGGDPLTIDNEKLSEIITSLEDIKHIQTLRIHTRLPVVLPNRIDTGLVNILQASRFHVVMVIHANHPNELQTAESDKLHLLHSTGVTLLNQSVLLAAINDDPETLIRLGKRLFQCRTLPYYLHSLDPVNGGMHYEVSKKRAVTLLHQLETRLPGYLVPRLVEEIPGNPSKTAIYNI